MLTIKEACADLGITYETLRFYCDEGLVPNVSRDKNNYRLFSEKDLNWVRGLLCLKRCGMRIRDMKQYMSLCLQGKDTIPQRRAMLDAQLEALNNQIEALSQSKAYLEQKQHYYDDVLAGRLAYTSNLIDTGEE